MASLSRRGAMAAAAILGCGAGSSSMTLVTGVQGFKRGSDATAGQLPAVSADDPTSAPEPTSADGSSNADVSKVLREATQAAIESGCAAGKATLLICCMCHSWQEPIYSKASSREGPLRCRELLGAARTLNKNELREVLYSELPARLFEALSALVSEGLDAGASSILSDHGDGVSFCMRTAILIPALSVWWFFVELPFERHCRQDPPGKGTADEEPPKEEPLKMCYHHVMGHCIKSNVYDLFDVLLLELEDDEGQISAKKSMLVGALAGCVVHLEQSARYECCDNWGSQTEESDGEASEGSEHESVPPSLRGGSLSPGIRRRGGEDAPRAGLWKAIRSGCVQSATKLVNFDLDAYRDMLNVSCELALWHHLGA